MKLPKDACVRVFVDLSNKQVWWLGGVICWVPIKT